MPKSKAKSAKPPTLPATIYVHHEASDEPGDPYLIADTELSETLPDDTIVGVYELKRVTQLKVTRTLLPVAAPASTRRLTRAGTR